MASSGALRSRASARPSRYFRLLAALLVVVAASTLYFSYEEAVLPTGSPSFPSALAGSSISLSLMLPLIALTYLTSRGLPLAGALRSLGLGKGKLSITTIVTIGIGVFLAILGVEIALSLFQAVTNISLPTNVQSLLQGQALYYIVFAALIGPINEEIFFRGFLVPRFGIVLSALLFMMLHSGYASVAELIGAFVFGLLAGYVFKRTGSLYTTIIGHILVNSMALFFIMAI